MNSWLAMRFNLSSTVGDNYTTCALVVHSLDLLLVTILHMILPCFYLLVIYVQLVPLLFTRATVVQIVIDGLIVIVWDKAGDSLSHHQTDNHKTTRLVESDFAKDGNMCSLKTVSVQLANSPCLPVCLLACVLAHQRRRG